MTSIIPLRSLLLALFLFLHWNTNSIDSRPLPTTSLSFTPNPYHHQHNSYPTPTLNLRPIIGILSQSGEPAKRDESYIAASYIKFVEMAGARAVPIFHDLPPSHLERAFKTINGLILPGGGQPLEPGHSFYDAASVLYKLAIKANDDGDFFPVQGTCLGFEALAIIASGDNSTILTKFDAEDYAQPLKPTSAAKMSKLLSSLPPSVVKDLYTKPYAMENHEHGLSPAVFRENPQLADTFDILTTSVDRQGVEYVSTIEAKDYPFTGTQWHPEKNVFEWTPDLHIPHEPPAIAVTQAMANYFVGEARKNQHQPESMKEEERMLIYNWKAKYTGKHTYEGEETAFEQTYVFPDGSDWSDDATDDGGGVESKSIEEVY